MRTADVFGMGSTIYRKIRLSWRASALIYLILLSGVLGLFWMLREAPQLAFRIVVYDHRNQVVEEFRAAPGASLRYKMRDQVLWIHQGGRTVLIQSGQWYKVDIER
jgi:hypothetical protein